MKLFYQFPWKKIGHENSIGDMPFNGETNSFA